MDNKNTTGETDSIEFGVTSHYNQYQGFEVVDVCEQLRAPDGSGNFNRGNAFKYLARAGWKNPDKHVEDLEKAIIYIQREIDRINGANEIIQHHKQQLSSGLKDMQEEAVEGERHWLDGLLKKALCPECKETLEEWFELGEVRHVCPNGHGFMKYQRINAE